MSSAAHAIPLDNNSGWKASLSLSFEAGPSKPFVRRSHSGPLTVQRPFYPEESVVHVYLLHPPGGVVGGDELSIDVCTQAGAAGLLTTPGATKFYRSKGSMSSVNQYLDVQAGSLEWFPQENIFFDSCNVELSTTLVATSESAFAFWDIQCFGRPAGGQSFIAGSVCSKLVVILDGVPIFIDRLLVNEQYPVSQATVLRGHTVSGTLLLSGMTKDSLEFARQCVVERPEFGLSLVDSLLVVRYLGDSAQQAKEGFTSVWSRLRRQLNNQSPCVPRIWAT